MTPRVHQADKPLWLISRVVPLLSYIKFAEAGELNYALAAPAEIWLKTEACRQYFRWPPDKVS
jgi:hypothetical protein